MGMSVGVSAFGDKEKGHGCGMHDVEEGKWACKEEPGLAHRTMWQAWEWAGHAEDEVNVCIGEVCWISELGWCCGCELT